MSSLYGDLPPPTHSSPGGTGEKEETAKQQSTTTTSASTTSTSTSESTSTSKPSKSALPANQIPSSQQQSNTAFSSPPPFQSHVSPTQALASSIDSRLSIAMYSSTTSPPKQNSSPEDVNDFKSVLNSQRNQRSGFDKSMNKGKKQAPLLLEDDYDPTRPNDYEDYKEVEKRRREDEIYRRQEERKRQKSTSPERDRRSPRRHFPPPPLLYDDSPQSEIDNTPPVARSPPAKIDLDMTGEEAFLRRARLSNRAHEETSKSPEPKSTAGLGSGEDFAHRMLTKFGWQEGHGLGRNEQGISEPLAVQKTDVRSGIIVNNNTPGKSEKEGENSARYFPDTELPSRVILLTNMVGPGEVDDTLQEETADECNEKYGTVERCLIFEVPHGKIPDDEAVRIFVKFEDIVAAIRAKKDLHGRFFGGRQVTAQFFDEQKFDRLDLAPSQAELQRSKQKENLKK
ncbi:18040_t:CDS:2 [Funneliformis geosporum]|uniref:18040_t:CDS:1 n=1 Tax=Funneliformis geosporum TaxID=1117311 RepID=A0A9W4WVR4_9GLOM|nr:18040_t:CDS:2 [Funneliformis geosporum]